LQEREAKLAEREQAVLELEQLARSAHGRLTEFAEEEVSRRWQQLEEVLNSHIVVGVTSNHHNLLASTGRITETQ